MCRDMFLMDRYIYIGQVSTRQWHILVISPATTASIGICQRIEMTAPITRLYSNSVI